MIKFLRSLFILTAATSFLIFSGMAAAQDSNNKAGIVIKAGLGQAEKALETIVKPGRQIKKNNKLRSTLLDILEVASHQKLEAISFYALEDENFKEGKPHDNFVLFIKGSYTPKLIFDQLKKINPSFLKIAEENGTQVIYLTSDISDEDLCGSFTPETPLIIKYFSSFFMTELIDNNREVRYSGTFVNNENFVFGPKKFIEKIIREKTLLFSAAEQIKNSSDSSECFIYFKNAGKIIDNLINSFAETHPADCFKNMEKIVLFQDINGSFNVSLSFKTKNDSDAAAALINSSKTQAADYLITKMNHAQANSISTAEAAIQLKDAAGKLQLINGNSGEIILSLKSTPKIKKDFNKLCVAGALAAFSSLNMIRAKISAEKESCISNMKTIDGAVQLYSMENNTLPETIAELQKKDCIKSEITCPGNGTYTIKAAGENKASIICSKHGELKE